jgi:hypothetical protein
MPMWWSRIATRKRSRGCWATGRVILVASGTFALLGVPSLFVLADLDGDGWQDAVTGCYNAAEFMVTPGVAGGSFGPAFAQPVSDVTPAIAVANLDADAIPDVIVLDYYSNRYEVLRGTGAFTFAPPQFFGAARSAYGIAVGDLNGGGKRTWSRSLPTA